MPTRPLKHYMVWLYTARVIVPTILLGVFGTFPNIRVKITRNGRSCDVQRHWLAFVYNTRAGPCVVCQ